MNPNLESLKRAWADADFTVSPADCLDLVVGSDAEGWPVYRTVAVGDEVLVNGYQYKVDGFTTDNTVLIRPFGLRREFAVTGKAMRPEGLEFPAPMYDLRHSTGFVTFAG